MAKIHTDKIVIEVNKLVKNDETPESVVTEDIVATLQAVAEELFPNHVIEVGTE